MNESLMKNYQPKIMVVDDTPANLNLLSAVLKDCGYQVRLAPSGSLALRAILADPPDLILLDVLMPEMDGFEVCRILKDDEKTKGIPVIFMTALKQQEDEEKGFLLGAVDYITKPLNIPIVKARVNTHLQLKFHKDKLEQLVQKRTAEIVQINKNLLSEIEERKRAEAIVKSSLQEKEILLKELYHRTRNNMQIIMSMLSIKNSSIMDEEILLTYKEMINRIQAMAKIHEKLYQSQNLSRINLKEYLEEMADNLLISYSVPKGKIALKLELEPIEVLIDSAIPCGQIANELLSNAIKYAFPGNQKGEIEIKLSRNSDGLIELIIADNGVGIPGGPDLKKYGKLGLMLAASLAESQLRGKIKFETGHGVIGTLQFSDRWNSESA